MRLRWLLNLAIFFLITETGQAQTISWNEFLNDLKRLHPLFDKERLTTQIEREERRGYPGAQDWNLSSSIVIIHEEPAIAFAEPEKTNGSSFYASVERVFWKTGGRFSVSFSSSYAAIEIDPFYGFPSSFYEN